MATKHASAGWEFLRLTQATVNERLRATVNQRGQPMSTVAGYHFAWCDASGTPAEAIPGRGIRPALVML